MRALGALLVLGALPACRGRAPRAAPADARPPTIDARRGPPAPWPELDGLARAAPLRTVTLPARDRVPRVAVVGPVMLDGLAVVAGSQLGVAAVDAATGAIAWRKPGGLHVAPLTLLAPDAVLVIGDCSPTPLVPLDQRVLGCARVLSPGGDELLATPLVGARAEVDRFADARGAEVVLAEDDATVRWQRGDAAVRLNLRDGRVASAAPTPPEIVVRDGARGFHIAPVGTALRATDDRGAEAWRIDPSPFAAMLGVVPGRPPEGPLLRVLRIGGFDGEAQIGLVDVEPTGSLNAQTAIPLAGIGVLAHAMAPDGRTALAVRLDASIERDVVALYDHRAALMWVWQLPQVERADPVGLAFDDDRLLVLHDGVTLTVLPAAVEAATALDLPTP